jgi:hypothetical protein
MSRNNGIPIPSGLKKKLQANLENLSAKEAGRLLLIYTQESDKKGIVWDEYKPTRELWSAYEAMVSKSRGKAEEKAAVNRYNGLAFLARLINSINRNALTMAFATGHDATASSNRLERLLFQIFIGDLAFTVKAIFENQTPAPVTLKEYTKIVHWLEEEEISSLEAAADVTVEFMLNEGLRDEEVEGKTEEIYKLLKEAMKKGELIGGEAWDCEALYDEDRSYPFISRAMLIKDGNIPGWLALRVAWRSWLEAQDMTISETTGDYDLDKFTPDGIYDVIGADGHRLTYEAVVELAEKFYKACRRKAWGKTLIEKPDPALFITSCLQEAKPFLYANAPDFGPVNWRQFKRTEEPSEGWKTGIYATNKSLDKKIEALELPGYPSNGLVQGFDRDLYYVHSMPRRIRGDRSHALRLLSIMTLGYQRPQLRMKGESPSLTNLVGIQLSTPIEEAVKETQDVYNFLESITQAFKVISDRYFGGLPVVWGEIQAHYERSRNKLEQTRIALEKQLKQISFFMNDVDIEPLRLAPPTADQAIVDRLVQRVIDDANTSSASIEELLKD